MAPTSPREMLQAIARNLPNRTGKTLEQWARLVKTKGPKTTRERIAWLRKHHSLGGPTAAVIVAKAEGQDLAAPYEVGDEFVEDGLSLRNPRENRGGRDGGGLFGAGREAPPPSGAEIPSRAFNA